MRLSRTKRVAFALAAPAMTVALLAGCSSDDSTVSDATGAAGSAASEVTGGSDSSTATSSEAMGEEAAGPVGPGCADYAAANASGPGSVDGMALDPVATAASNNPLLTTLTQAVSGQLNPEVNLVDTLNGGEFTVFAPVNDAFAALPPETLEAAKTDAALLTTVLTYHVVEGRIAPADLAGTHATVAGPDLEVTGTPEALTVNGTTNVICGGVETANATVYLVDSVLMPPM